MITLNSIKEIIKNINFLKKYEDKLFYLIELGKTLPINKKNIKKKKYIIYGCQSKVWLKIKNKNNLIYINGDSNSLITKGFLLIIIKTLNNKKIKNIKITNIYNILKNINIFKNLIYLKTIGIKSILNYINNYIKNIKQIK